MKAIKMFLLRLKSIHLTLKGHEKELRKLDKVNENNISFNLTFDILTYRECLQAHVRIKYLNRQLFKINKQLFLA